VTLDEARIRLEGALETLEAGTQRYRRLSHQLDRIRVMRPEVEELVAAEDGLEAAARRVSELQERERSPELLRELEVVGEARRTLRLRVRERLHALNFRRSGLELVDELEILQRRAFPPLSRPPVARFWVAKQMFGWRPAAVAATVCVCFVLAEMFFRELWLVVGGLGAYIIAMSALLGRRYARLDVHGDRLRLKPVLGTAHVVALSQLGQLEPLAFDLDQDRLQVVALAELLDHSCFKNAGDSSGESVVGADTVGTHKRVAAILGTDHALVIDETAHALDAAVGQRCSWTQPRAYLLALILIRLPEDDRALIVKRLTVAGLARTVPRDDFYRDFRTL
jgi:hypothetical protein